MTNNTPHLPNSLIEAVRYFADADRCFEFVKVCAGLMALWSAPVAATTRLRS
jgi:hypothetical protein